MWKCTKCGREFKYKVPAHGTFENDGKQTHREPCTGTLKQIS